MAIINCSPTQEINIGANASAEGGEEQLDDSVETVDAIEFTFNLKSFDMDKKTLQGWLKSYFQAIRKMKKDAGVPQEEIKEFMAGAPVSPMRRRLLHAFRVVGLCKISPRQSERA